MGSGAGEPTGRRAFVDAVWVLCRRLAARLNPVLAVVAVLVGSGAGVALAAGGDRGGSGGASGPTATVSGAPDAAALGRELPALRTRTSRTYEGEDGTLVARAYATSIHFRDSGGRWQAIDNGLSKRGGVYRNAANAFGVELPAALQSGAVRVTENGRWASLKLRGARGQGEISGATALYRDALPDVDVRYRVVNDALKEDLILHGPPTAGALRYDVAASDGLTPRLRQSGIVEFEDAAGVTHMTFAAPFMSDAAGAESRGVELGLERSGKGWLLELRPDAQWLAAGERQWPVTVDPGVYPTPGRDCYIEDGPDTETSFCGSDSLHVGWASYANEDHRALLDFDVQSVVPADSEILSGALGLYLRETTSTSEKPIQIHRMTAPWGQGASWNRYDGVNRWQSPGGDFAEDREPHRVRLGDANDLGRYAWWDVKELVETWARGRNSDDRRVQNFGLMVREPQSDPRIDNRLTFNSSEHADTSTLPYLDIQYTRRVGERRGWTFEEFGLSDRMTLKVNPAGGNLLLRQTDVELPGGLGPDMSFGRSYNSLGSATFYGEQPSFGSKWTTDTGQNHRVRYGSNAHYYGPSGSVVTFKREFNPDGTFKGYKTPPGFDATLRAANSDGSGVHTLIEHKTQRKLRFEASFGVLSSIEDRNGRTVTLDYRNPGGRWGVEKITDARGKETTFAYNARDQIQTMTDPAGRQYSYGYSADGSQLLTYTDSDNGVTHYDYDTADRLTKVTTPAGRITIIGYYAAGHADEGKVQTVTRVTNTTAMTGPTWRFAYDQDRDGTGTASVTDPRGYETHYRFDKHGRPDRVTDALGREAKTSYTSNSNVETYTAPTNTGSAPSGSLQYDADGNLEKTSTLAGSGSMETGASHGATQTGGGAVQGGQYLPTLVQNEQDTASGSTTQGTQISYENPEGNPTLIKSSAMSTGIDLDYENGPDGKPGKLASTTDPRGNTTSYGYDSSGNLTSIDHPAITPSSATQLGTEQLAYDGAGGADQALSRISTYTDGRGNTVSYEYDGLDRVTTQIHRYPGSGGVQMFEEARFEFVYDDDGNLIERRDVVGGVTKTYTFSYDELNRITGEQRPDGTSSTYTYDPNGNLASLTDAGGKVEYAYDALNRLAAVYEPGQSTPISINHRETSGDDDSTTDDNGLKQTWRYPNGMSTTKLFDSADRLQRTETKKSGGAVVQRLVYDYLAGSGTGAKQIALISKITDEDNNTTDYSYQPVLDRLLSATENRGGTVKTWSYDYDAAGNMLKRSATGEGDQHNRFNEANQLCWREEGTLSGSFPDCTTVPSGARTYQYDANGNETVGTNGQTSTYNARNQLIERSGLDREYAGPGQSQRIKASGSTFTNDILGVGSWSDSGTTIYYTRDGNGRILSHRNPAAPAPDDTHYFLHDHLGSTTALIDQAENTDRKNRYDPYGRDINTGSWSASTPFRYAGGFIDGTGLYHYGERYYHPFIGRWTQTDPLNHYDDLRNHNRYAYGAGDPINNIDTTGEIAFAAPLVALGVKELVVIGVAAGAAAGATAAGIYYASEHKKNKRPSTYDKHTKPRPGRSSEKKKDPKKGWRPNPNKRQR